MGGTVGQEVDIYRGHVRYVKRRGEGLGFDVVAFLQPFLLTGFEVESGTASDFERQLYESQPKRLRAMVRLFYDRVAKSGEITNISRVLADSGEDGSYFDVVHLGPAGNQAVANAIFSHLP